MQKGIYRQTSIGVAAISFVLVEPVGTLAALTTHIGTLCQLSPSIVTSSSKGNSSNYSMPAMILGLATELGSCSDAVFPCIVSPEWIMFLLCSGSFPDLWALIEFAGVRGTVTQHTCEWVTQQYEPRCIHLLRSEYFCSCNETFFLSKWYKFLRSIFYLMKSVFIWWNQC